MSALLELFNQGGPVLWVIAALSLLAWTLVLWKCFELAGEKKAKSPFAKKAIDSLKAGNWKEALGHVENEPSALGRIMTFALQSPPTQNAFERHYGPFIESESLRLSQSLPFIAVIAATLPLLGLLGTVLGMVNTFGAITVQGNGDPAALADGVSQALITTQAGLVAGLPILLLHGWLRSRVEGCMDCASLFAKMVESNRALRTEARAYVSVRS
jgi:biopolymer transport protein ExbB